MLGVSMFLTINGNKAETSLPSVIPDIILRIAYLLVSKFVEFKEFIISYNSSFTLGVATFFF